MINRIEKLRAEAVREVLHASTAENLLKLGEDFSGVGAMQITPDQRTPEGLLSGYMLLLPAVTTSKTVSVVVVNREIYAWFNHALMLYCATTRKRAVSWKITLIMLEVTNRALGLSDNDVGIPVRPEELSSAMRALTFLRKVFTVGELRDE